VTWVCIFKQTNGYFYYRALSDKINCSGGCPFHTFNAFNSFLFFLSCAILPLTIIIIITVVLHFCYFICIILLLISLLFYCIAMQTGTIISFGINTVLTYLIFTCKCAFIDLSLFLHTNSKTTTRTTTTTSSPIQRLPGVCRPHLQRQLVAGVTAVHLRAGQAEPPLEAGRALGQPVADGAQDVLIHGYGLSAYREGKTSKSIGIKDPELAKQPEPLFPQAE